MMITVSLSAEEYRDLEKLAQYRAGIDAETLLRCFAGDLTHSDWTGGSDERLYAHQWLDRRFGDKGWAREYHRDRRARKGGRS
jgi:hypothetical protein